MDLELAKFDHYLALHWREPDLDLYYLVSAIKWARFRAINTDVRAGHAIDLSPVTSYLQSLRSRWHISAGWLDTPGLDDSLPLPTAIPDLVREVSTYCTHAPYAIMFDYFRHAAALESAPYQWPETRNLFWLDDLPSFSLMHHDMERVLDKVIYRHLDTLKNSRENHWIDDIVHTVVAS